MIYNISYISLIISKCIIIDRIETKTLKSHPIFFGSRRFLTSIISCPHPNG